MKELAMPDLDLIKQAEQEVCDGRRRFLRVKMANDTPHPNPPPLAEEGRERARRLFL